MNKKPRVSIGLPVYNAERYLRYSLDSILAQSFGDFELIISDNASTDSTHDICLEYASKDERIRLYRNERNLGAAENFNRVFTLATSEYFKWAAYDDVCAPTFLEKCVDALDRDPQTALSYPKTILIDDKGAKIRDYEDRLHMPYDLPHDRARHFLTKVNLANAAFGLVRSSVLRETRLLGKYFGADYVLLLEICLRGRFHEVPEHLFFRRDHERNSRRLPKKEIAVWWDSSRKSVYKFNRSKLVLEQFMAISRTGLPLYEKSLCMAQIGRWITRQWRARAGRLKNNLKQLMHQPKAQKNTV
ncbi:MAG TPA: glycosyltransferase family 2 protein [Deltaproteobacteria bacterium]|nr:MAG: hypothetical protein A2Z79_10340 [Deltaproteobacteria bacterium GWA2_55_82]OGQ62969.1 MAG: hypothetical protein A3I81_06625 [Deltaproteobacteria bacterium RIFCSPLOWO2_02_FULL_55_12]OIJ72932.1 MAG: hypothetical protein A2V21_300865 [Deltaproteobacteria bacterium GWC2_55_46]HBG46063.1 glycosyltransferase family 2 protein [Deltaproteobacteria bacterium]HCY11719.1 glycosyltransferase family 2 protein [Deltaproteobacteria bacterium]